MCCLLAVAFEAARGATKRRRTPIRLSYLMGTLSTCGPQRVSKVDCSDESLARNFTLDGFMLKSTLDGIETCLRMESFGHDRRARQTDASGERSSFGSLGLDGDSSRAFSWREGPNLAEVDGRGFAERPDLWRSACELGPGGASARRLELFGQLWRYFERVWANMSSSGATSMKFVPRWLSLVRFWPILTSFSNSRAISTSLVRLWPIMTRLRPLFAELSQSSTNLAHSSCFWSARSPNFSRPKLMFPNRLKVPPTLWLKPFRAQGPRPALLVRPRRGMSVLAVRLSPRLRSAPLVNRKATATEILEAPLGLRRMALRRRAARRRKRGGDAHCARRVRRVGALVRAQRCCLRPGGAWQ